MNRIVLVHGPWQLLIAASALRQASRAGGRPSRDILVYISLPDGPLPMPMRQVMDRMAPALWPWHRIVVLDEAIRGGLDDVRGSIEAIRALLPGSAPAEIWLDCLWGGPEKLLAEAFPAARLVLYEDGLHSYLANDDHYLSVPRLIGDPRGAYRALKLRLRELRRPNALTIAMMLPRHVARVSASYLWVSLMLPPADYQRRLPLVQLQTPFVKESLARLAPFVEDVRMEPGGPRALVMGQCFSNYGDLARQSELDFYAGMAGRLQDCGYEVIWKEHPRTRRPFLPQLAEAVPGVRGTPDWGPWPVELFVERLGLSACAGISSTSLFTIPLLFGLPSYSPAGRLQELFRFPDSHLARLVAASIPELPDRTAA
jgi:hypothetical protein